MRKAYLMTALGSAVLLAGAARADSVLLLPEPGSMMGATFIVDPKDRDPNTFLVCASLSHLAAGNCEVRRVKKRKP